MELNFKSARQQISFVTTNRNRAQFFDIKVILIKDASSGGAEDFAKGRLGIKYAYCLELRPSEGSSNGFILPENFIPIGKLFSNLPLNFKLKY